ncbi:prephenate dehydrogenase [Janibacter alittae]|uniref:Prephenate dehydrogenase n=1 Tax=Janibacter alittae TaxID=3115209 RepID=A0ABZ2MLJ8_9MICO
MTTSAEPKGAASGLPPVHVIGTGLIGTSVGLALRATGVDVSLEDQSETSVALARDLGAGRITGEVAPGLVVVATPPDVAPTLVQEALRRWPEAVVTDVTSVKQVVLADIVRSGVPMDRYVGSHPMAGRERSGAISGRADLFEGRAWVLCPHETTQSRATELVGRLARATGAAVSTLSPHDHDAAVAAVSHVPQVAASLVAARLEHLSEQAIGLAGQGVRDVTRIAASDPGLWTQILSGNAPAVAAILRDLSADVTRVVAALEALGGEANVADAPGARAVLARSIADGNAGHSRIPGKHGAGTATYAVVSVVVDDSPGELARLLAEIGEEGVNLEDLRLDHGIGLPFGLAEVHVLPQVAGPLTEALQSRGWQIHG